MGIVYGADREGRDGFRRVCSRGIASIDIAVCGSVACHSICTGRGAGGYGVG